MITHVAKLDAASHLNDINNALDERDLDAYHKLFDAYSDDLDKLASIAFEWAREYDVSHIEINRPEGHSEAYFLTLNEVPTLINANGIDGVAGYVDSADDLADMMSYEYANITVSANAA